MCTPSHFYSSFSRSYLTNKGGRYPKFFSKVTRAEATTFAYAVYLLVGQFFGRMSTASARYCVTHVIRLRSKYEVLRVYTLWVVAGMAHYLLFWYVTFMQHVRQACSPDYFSAFSARANNAIPAIGFSTCPRPTFAPLAFNYLCPKPGNECRAFEFVNHAKENTYVYAA